MLTTVAKNEALNAIGTANTKPALSMSHAGLYTADTAITAVKSTSEEVLEKTSHGLETGDLVLLTALEGGSSVVAERIYFVKKVTANTFSLSLLVAGTPLITFGSAITSVTVTKYKEVSGGSYARIAAKVEGAAGGSIEDATEHKFKVPAGTINAISHHSASTVGTLLDLELVTPAVFAEAGEYSATKSTLDLNAAK